MVTSKLKVLPGSVASMHLDKNAAAGFVSRGSAFPEMPDWWCGLELPQSQPSSASALLLLSLGGAGCSVGDLEDDCMSGVVKKSPAAKGSRPYLGRKGQEVDFKCC